ncbi:hypothetical protein VTL71DRAFT_5362 [Oculimacula yallundae]|uniref:Uncharacterized protein n=1 Tax=Oculimacula yallundae TaxID=86028 RepID=A0ABR4C1X0_9HELO
MDPMTGNVRLDAGDEIMSLDLGFEFVDGRVSKVIDSLGVTAKVKDDNDSPVDNRQLWILSRNLVAQIIDTNSQCGSCLRRPSQFSSHVLRLSLVVLLEESF